MLIELPEGYQGDYYEDVRAMLTERIHLASVLTRKLAPMPFELADPVWIEDDDIDLDYHLRTFTLRRPGTMEQLERLIARLHSSLLDRSRPLWEMYVIDGLQSGQIAFYTKAHHSGVDGKAGVELAKVLYDLTPQPRPVRPKRPRHGGGRYQLGVAEMLQATASNSALQYRKLMRLGPTAMKAAGAAGRVLARQRTPKGERSLILGTAPSTIFNVAITNQRSYSTMSVPLDDLKALGTRVGGTVNTIVMAMCSSALRRFLKERDLLPGQSLLAMVPVSLRAADDTSMNNQVSAIRVDLATDIDDLEQRFKAIHNSSEAAKAVVRELKPVLGVDMPVLGSPWLMSSIASMVGRSQLVSRVPQAANVAISNVPGPPVALYVAGARMVHYFPVSIPSHAMGLNITVQSYAGSLEWGLTACRRVLSQEESYELIEYLRDALEEIRALPGSAPAAAASGGGGASESTAAKKSTTKESGLKPAKAARARHGA